MHKAYDKQYEYLGRTLGNEHYKQPERGIKIVDLEQGCMDLFALLLQDYTLLLLCGCGNYETCHRRVIAEAMLKWSPEIEILLPETLIAREQAIQHSLAERETLYQELNSIKPSLVSYWELPKSDQDRLRRETGK